MKLKQANYDAYRLLHEGAVALAEVQHNGVKMDVDLLDKQMETAKNRIDKITNRLHETKEWREWKRRWGNKANLGSNPQVGWLLKDQLGVKLDKKTDKGADAVSDDVLDDVDHPFVADLRRLRKNNKIRNTYLSALKREITGDGYLHVNYWLNRVKSYRSSSSDLNFQNFPVRDPEYAELVRTLFVPRSYKNVLVERDFAGIEVGMSCCYHRDPVMVKYVTENGDMHSDLCRQLFMLEKDQVNKMSRYVAKNGFTFAEFYGSYWRDCAKAIWKAMRKLKLKVGKTDESLFDHLKKKGIKELGTANSNDEIRPNTFQQHVYNVEKDLWNRRFRVYAQWKKDYYAEYLRRGYFESKTGFVYRGHHVRNDVVNYGIQGSAFHYLLKSLILLMKAVRKYKMKTLVIGQIHDSMLNDTPEKELQDFLDLSTEVCQNQTPKGWDWINVPMRVEAEVCEGNWFNKKEWTKQGDLWQPKA